MTTVVAKLYLLLVNIVDNVTETLKHDTYKTVNLLMQVIEFSLTWDGHRLQVNKETLPRLYNIVEICYMFQSFSFKDGTIQLRHS